MGLTVHIELHKIFTDWRAEVGLCLDTVLSLIKDKTTKMKLFSLWSGKEARTYLNIMDQVKQNTLNTMTDLNTGQSQKWMK